MVNSFKTWSSVNERHGSTGGREHIWVKGKKINIVYKVQNKAQFMIKIVHSVVDQIDDNKGTLTSLGASSILNYVNASLGLVQTFGKMDTAFFGKKVLVYKILKDTSRTQKYQFTVTDRTLIAGLDPNTEFISTAQIANADGDEIQTVITDTEDKVKTDDTAENPTDAINLETGDGEGTAITIRQAGDRFRYKMRSNEKLYLCQFTENEGAIDCNVISGGRKPSGTVSWKVNIPIWITDEDNSGTTSTEPLYTDTEILDPTDKKFFTRMFTDDDYLNKIISEYKDKYGSSELNGENLKNMLYYNGTEDKIFPSEVEDEGEETADAGTVGTAGTAVRTQKMWDRS
jgi:hypothetical protein